MRIHADKRFLYIEDVTIPLSRSLMLLAICRALLLLKEAKEKVGRRRSLPLSVGAHRQARARMAWRRFHKKGVS